jgi:hypothetical protein
VSYERKIGDIFSPELFVYLILFTQHFDSWYDTIGTATGYGLGGREVGFRFPKEARFFLFLIELRLAIGLNQPLIQWIPGTLSLELHRSGRGTPSGAQVKNARIYTSTPPYLFMIRCLIN